MCVAERLLNDPVCIRTILLTLIPESSPGLGIPSLGRECLSRVMRLLQKYLHPMYPCRNFQSNISLSSGNFGRNLFCSATVILGVVRNGTFGNFRLECLFPLVNLHLRHNIAGWVTWSSRKNDEEMTLQECLPACQIGETEIFCKKETQYAILPHTREPVIVLPQQQILCEYVKRTQQLRQRR